MSTEKDLITTVFTFYNDYKEIIIPLGTFIIGFLTNTFFTWMQHNLNLKAEKRAEQKKTFDEFIDSNNQLINKISDITLKLNSRLLDLDKGAIEAHISIQKHIKKSELLLSQVSTFYPHNFVFKSLIKDATVLFDESLGQIRFFFGKKENLKIGIKFDGNDLDYFIKNTTEIYNEIILIQGLQTQIYNLFLKYGSKTKHVYKSIQEKLDKIDNKLHRKYHFNTILVPLRYYDQISSKKNPIQFREKPKMLEESLQIYDQGDKYTATELAGLIVDKMNEYMVFDKKGHELLFLERAMDKTKEKMLKEFRDSPRETLGIFDDISNKEMKKTT